MPDVTSVAVGATTVGANYNKFRINTSDAGRELVVRVDRAGGAALTDALLLAAYRQLTLSAGTPAYNVPDVNGPDAGTTAAVGTADGSAFVSGTTTAVFVRLQTTGTPNTADIVDGAGNVQFTTVAVFQPAK
jgi:hypothetical protein